MNDYNEKAVDAPVTVDEVAAMIRGMLRSPVLLKDALRLGLDGAHFNQPGEIVFYFLFAAMSAVFKKHGTVTEEILLNVLQSWRSAGSMPIPDEDAVYLFGDETGTGFIADAFNVPELELKDKLANKQYAEDILRRFMHARVVKQQINAALQTSAQGSPVGLQDKLAGWAKTAQSIQFIGRELRNAAAMPDFGTHIALPPPAVPTGMPWIDEYIDGFRAGDILGLLGPTGGGKSTLMAIAAVRMAQQYYCTGANKLSVYIMYEDGEDKFNFLLWSAASHIARDSFKPAPELNKSCWDYFSHKDNLKPYDRHLPENRNGKIVVGERERWQACQPWLNQHLFFLDFSANATSGNYGTGGVAEIFSVLSALREQTGKEIGFVAVDYAGLMLNRELGKNNSTKNMEQVWRPLQQLPDNLRTEVVGPLACTLMLAHQIAGADAKKMPPYRFLDHLSAQGSKAFAENLHACLCLNSRDAKLNVSTLNWSKVRYCRPHTPHGILKFDDDVVDVRLANKEYEVCETARRIVKRGESGLVTPDAVHHGWKANKLSVDTFGSSVID